ncbi:hypothetical protein [uncultured Microbacterium sp.]|uniref:hypothetical protein n=1 Tax=uncultured Microbacterium sp. TaxID=191216 RepID=UPI002633C4AD|nr:hypothetical protein [uncultured Microbacterium sp.]
MSVRARRGWALAGVILASGGVGYGLRSAFPPYPALTTPVVIDEALWRAILSGPPMAGVFAVIAAVIAFTPAIRSTKIARENAAREQWWNRAQWALGLAASDDQEDREVANDALQALLEDATPTEGKMIYRTIKNLQRPAAVDTPAIATENRPRRKVIRWLGIPARPSPDAS